MKTVSESALAMPECKYGDSTPVSFFQVEYTDTFGGEANYSWVRRATIATRGNASDGKIKRTAKASVGLTAVRGKWETAGEILDFRPYDSCTVLFVSPLY